MMVFIGDNIGRIYGFLYNNFIVDNMEEKKVVKDHHITLNQYQRLKKKKVLYVVILY